MNMLKKTLLTVLLGLSVFAPAQTITTIGSLSNIKLSQYPIDLRNLNVAKGEKIEGLRELRFCESLDNSNLVIIGMLYQGWESMFSSQSICNSFADVLRRGGTIYIGVQDGVSLGCVGPNTHAFFKSIDSAAWTRSEYNSFGKTAGNRAKCISAGGYDWIPEGTEILAISSFGSLDGKPWQPLFTNEQNEATAVIHENVLGKGTIILCSSLDFFRQVEHPLLTALVKKAFGKLRRKSLQEQKTVAATAKESLPANFIYLPNGGTATLSSAKSKETTAVEISANGSILTFAFHCTHSNPKENAAKILNRDGAVWTDASVEIVLAGSRGISAPVYHFIVNNAGVIYDAKNGNAFWNAAGIKTQIIETEQEWQAILQLDSAELGLDKSDILYANMSRNNTATKSYLLWSEAPGGLRNRKAFGMLSRIERQAAAEKLALPKGAGIFRLAQLPVPTRLYIDSDAPDNAGEQLDKIRIVAAKNTKEAAEIGLYNGENQTVVLRFEAVDELEGSADTTLARSVFTVKEGVPILDAVGNIHLDALSVLNEAWTITIPSGETRLLWIEANTATLGTGIYKWNIELVHTMLPKPPIKTVIKLEVIDWRMPDDFGFVFRGYGPYAFSYARGKIEAYWKICKEYHFDAIQISGISRKPFIKHDDGTISLSNKDEDYLSAEKELTGLGFSWVYGYGILAFFDSHMKRLGGPPFSTPEGKELFTQWIMRFGQALRNAGIDFSRASCPMLDEPRSEDIPRVIEAAIITKKAGFQIFNNFATWSTVNDVRQFEPYCDLVSSWEPRLLIRPTSAEEIALLRKRNRPWITYLCSPSGNLGDLVGDFRLRGIRSYLLQTDGFEMWAINSWRDNDWEAIRPGKNTQGMWLVQHGNDGPIPTIRLEAFFEGAKDLCILREAEKSSSKTLRELCAEKYLGELQAEQNAEKLVIWREKLLRGLGENEN